MMISATRFFEKLRLLLAAGSPAEALGAVARDGIEQFVLPKLKDRLADESDEGRREELREQVELWQEYADPKTSEGESWEEEAMSVVSSQVEKYGFSQDKTRDVAGYTASALYEHGKVEKMFSRFDVDSGPRGLLKLFKKVVSEESGDELRRMKRDKERGVSAETPLGEDEGSGEMKDLIEDVRSGDVGGRELEMLRDNMVDWMHHETSGYVETLFDIWMEVTSKIDPDKVQWQKDVLPLWKEETGKSAALMWKHKPKLFEKMMDYFKDVLEMDIDQRTLEELKLARVADRFWRRKFAEWMLAPARARTRTRRNLNAAL